MSWQKWASEYLAFSRRDRIAVIALLILITAVFLLPDLVPVNNNNYSARPDTAWIAAMNKIQVDTPESDDYSNENSSVVYQYDRPIKNYDKADHGKLFFFDPNTLSDDGWKKLGLRNKTITTIRKFLAKGGKFRKPEDLSRIYGLFPNEYKRIEPYIRIEHQIVSGTYNRSTVKDSQQYVRKSFPEKKIRVDINTADTSGWIALPGIGNKLATRIVSFREKLGGFYSISQVAETFGLADSTFQKIKQFLKIENNLVRRININTATLDELKAHPYIRYAIANAIVAYRNEHGAFPQVDGIRKIMAVTDDIYNRLMPYLTVN